MIYGLKFMSTQFDVRPNSKGKLNITTEQLDGEGKPVVIKTAVDEVSSVSYWMAWRQDNREENEAFIKKMMARFPHSLHVCHLTDVSDLTCIADTEVFDKIPLIVHMGVNDVDLQALQAGSDLMIGLPEGTVESRRVDRVMLDDNTQTLFTVDANKLRKIYAKAFCLSIESVGVCGSPLSMGETCCLTAQRHREWAARYVTDPFVVLASANHQGGVPGQHCACLREYPVTKDIITMDAPKKGAPKKGPASVKIKAPAGPKRSAKAVRHP